MSRAPWSRLLAATAGGTQSLHTNALDEALALPTDFSARIARNTQLVLQAESGITRTIDPWGGSFYVERLTADLAARAWTHIAEVERSGGMAAAIEAGLPKARIEEAAARTQARIDAGLQTVVGVNRFRPEGEAPIDVLRIDNSAVLAAQVAKLERLRAERDEASVGAALAQLGDAGVTGHGNLLGLAVDAARAKATVGEISTALERSFGRHAATSEVISGVYRHAAGEGSAAVQKVAGLTAAFAQDAGRKPTILVAKVGQDGHDRGQKVIASAFSDLGFDVRVGPLFATPAEVADRAIAEDVHVLGISSLAAGHLTLVPAIRAALDAKGRPDILLVLGGVIPPGDLDAVKAGGVAAVFPPGTVVTEAAATLLAMLNDRLGFAQKAPSAYLVESTSSRLDPVLWNSPRPEPTRDAVMSRGGRFIGQSRAGFDEDPAGRRRPGLVRTPTHQP